MSNAHGVPLLGIDRVGQGRAELPRSARLGVLTNRAAQSSDGRWSGTVLMDAGYCVVLFLGPEHGLAGEAAAGAPVDHSRIGDIPALSMYGAQAGPVEEAMGTVDALVVDLPDVGCRYYTYPWTVRELLRMAGRHLKPVFLLDRPNPLNGTAIEGDVPSSGYDSAVCASRVPVRHGLTLGELSLWNQRDYDIAVDLSIITVEGWRRPQDWEKTGLSWVPPSPAIPDAATAHLYPGTCLLEGTNVSEGRGTDLPFSTAGAPFLDGEALADTLRGDAALDGVRVEPVAFTPGAGKWCGRRCQGVRLVPEDRARVRPVRAGLALVRALREYPDFSFIPGHFDALAGGGAWREALEGGAAIDEIMLDWPAAEAAFRLEREDILLYAG